MNQSIVQSILFKFFLRDGSADTIVSSESILSRTDLADVERREFFLLIMVSNALGLLFKFLFTFLRSELSISYRIYWHNKQALFADIYMIVFLFFDGELFRACRLAFFYLKVRNLIRVYFSQFFCGISQSSAVDESHRDFAFFPK